MRTTSPVVGASAALVVGCALSLGAALAHAAPTKPVAVAADAGATPLRLQTLKDIGTEEVAIRALTTQVADLESTRTEVVRRRTRLTSLTKSVLSLLGQPQGAHSDAEEAFLKRLKDELAAAGIGLDAQAVADLANALSQGGSGATALAFMLCTAIAEASEIRDPDAGAPPPSRHADTIKRLARATANHATLTQATVAPMLDAMLATPGVVPVARMDLEAAAKVTGPGAGQNFLGVLTRSYDGYVTKIGTSIDAAKQDMALRQGRVAVHRERLRTLPTP
jgi:hypothetical protein